MELEALGGVFVLVFEELGLGEIIGIFIIVLHLFYNNRSNTQTNTTETQTTPNKIQTNSPPNNIISLSFPPITPPRILQSLPLHFLILRLLLLNIDNIPIKRRIHQILTLQLFRYGGRNGLLFVLDFVLLLQTLDYGFLELVVLFVVVERVRVGGSSAVGVLVGGGVVHGEIVLVGVAAVLLGVEEFGAGEFGFWGVFLLDCSGLGYLCVFAGFV